MSLWWNSMQQLLALWRWFDAAGLYRPSEAIEELQMCGGSQGGVSHFWHPHPHQVYERPSMTGVEVKRIYATWGDSWWQLVLDHVLLDRGCMDQNFQALGPDFAPKCQVISTAAARRTGCELLRCGLCPNRAPKHFCFAAPNIHQYHIHRNGGGDEPLISSCSPLWSIWTNYSDFPIFAKTHLQVKSFSAMFSKLQGLRLSGFIETKQRRNFHNICFKLSAGRFFQLDGFQNFLKTSPNHSQTFFLVMTSIHGDCPLRWSGLKRAADQAKGKLERWNIAAGLKTS